MPINENNYEAYLLEYSEGTLSPEKEKELFQFITGNPRVKADTDIGRTLLTAGNIRFPGRDDLKKGGHEGRVTSGNYGQFCIAREEGDLSDEAAAALELFLYENPHYKHDAGTYARLKLQPDTAVKFENKHELRKSVSVSPGGAVVSGRIRMLYSRVSVAATIALLLATSLFVWHKTGTNNSLTDTERRIVSLPRHSTQAGALPVTGSSAGETIGGEGLNIEGLRATPAEYGNILSQYLVEEPETSVDNHAIGAGHERIILPAVTLRKQSPVLLSATYLDDRPVIAAINIPAVSHDRTGTTRPSDFVRGVTGMISSVLDEDRERDRLSLWELAETGVKSINSFAGTEIRLERELNPDGELVSMAFGTRLIGFERTVSFETE